MRDLLLKLCRREDLTRDEARAAFAHLMSGDATDAQIGGLLVGLAGKGTTVEELVGAATAMRERVIRIDAKCPVGQVVLDTCGTGGDVKGTFNISTCAAIIAAAAGVKVVKHGNRSASSKSGSADVLEKLGVKLDVSPETIGACLSSANICFAYARSHHPAMKFVAAARQQLGIPTIFNLLGPLTNPAGAKHQLLGVFAPELTDRLATVLRELGSTRAWVVHAEDGLDELSTLGPTRVSELVDGHITTRRIDPRDFDMPYARLSDLQASDADDSAAKIREALSGRLGPCRDIALLNAGAALVIAGASENLQTGLKRAAEAVDSGAATGTVEMLARLTRGN